MATDVQAIETALVDLRRGFSADGYDMLVEGVDAGTARIRIVAGPEACEDCLVPKETMRLILGSALKGLSSVTDVAVTYPADQEKA